MLFRFHAQPLLLYKQISVSTANPLLPLSIALKLHVYEHSFHSFQHIVNDKYDIQFHSYSMFY